MPVTVAANTAIVAYSGRNAVNMNKWRRNYSTCQRLSAAGRETDDYIAEAQDILIPPLERVLQRGA